MAKLSKRWWAPWAVSLGSVALAAGLTLALTPHLAVVPSALIFLAIIVASWRGHSAAGMLATVLGAFLRQLIHVRHTAATWGLDDWGNVLLLIGAGAIVSAVFARLRLEERKRASHEERFRVVFNQQFQFMAVLSPEGNLLEVNERALRATGATRGEVLGRKFWETPWWKDLPEMRRRWPERLKEAAQMDAPVFSEDQYQTLGGAVRVADAAITAVKDANGFVEFFIVQASDVTERKRAEEGLQKRNAGLRLLSDLAQQFLAATDSQTALEGAFQKLKQQIEVDAFFNFAVASGGDCLILSSHAGITGEAAKTLQRLAFGEAVCGRVAQQKQGYTAGHVAIANDPALAVVRALEFTAYTCNPLMAGDRLLGTLSFASRQVRAFSADDLELMEIVSRYAAMALQRLAAEEQLRRSNERLEQRVAERTGSLATSLQSIEELLYTIAHDLRAPNRAMEGYAELLQLEYGRQLDPTARAYLDRIVKAAHQNDELIRDLLQFGRVSHTDVPTEPLDPRPIIDETLAELGGEIKERHASVQVYGEWRRVVANPTLLKQVLLNLLTNALRYVPQDRKPRITVSAAPRDGKLALRIQDNGSGIAPELQHQAFKPFVRLAGDSQTPGTGMGLAIVRKAVTRMHGEVGMESNPGEGTCFWVKLATA